MNVNNVTASLKNFQKKGGGGLFEKKITCYQLFLNFKIFYFESLNRVAFKLTR